jgi:O-antigen ligase
VFIAIRIADSATSSVAIVVFVATCLFVLKANITPPNRIVSLLGAAILSLVIIVFNIQNYFQHLIVNILHRNITMTGRMQIWETASMKLKESWIFGNGYFIYYFPRGDITGQAHNTYLNILVVGGIVGLVLFFLIFLLNNKKAKNNNDHPYSKILRVGLMAYSVTFLTEMFKKPHFFIILIFLSYHIDEVIRQLPMPNSKLLSSEATHKNLLLRKRKC